jgi:hypothetical protein
MPSEKAFSLDGKFLTAKKSKLLNSVPCGAVRQSQFLDGDRINPVPAMYIALKRFSEGKYLGLWQNCSDIFDRLRQERRFIKITNGKT